MVNRCVSGERESITCLDRDGTRRPSSNTAYIASQICTCQVRDGTVVVCIGSNIVICGILSSSISQFLKYI